MQSEKLPIAGGRRARQRERFCTHTHIEMSRWVSNRASFPSLYRLKTRSLPLRASVAHFQDPSPFPLCVPVPPFPPPWWDALLFLLLLSDHVWGLFKHNLFPLASPGRFVQPFYCCVFLSFPSFCLPPIYLQLDVCSPIDCFTEDTSKLCLRLAGLYINPSVLLTVVLTNTHTKILSVRRGGVHARTMCVCHICWNPKVVIIGLSCHGRACRKRVCHRSL